MSLRKFSRRVAITSATTLGLDALARRRERRELPRRGSPLVRVLYMHATPADQADALRRHLAWLQQQFRLIDFATLVDWFESDSQPAGDGRPAMLLTFDDGLASNYEVAAPILEEAGVRGLFFVVPGFSVLTGDESMRFYRDRIRKRHSFEPSMTPRQIRSLADRGHAIGNHTFSHAHLAETPARDYDHEILDSAAAIESWIGRPVDAFAWPFVWNAITPAAHRLAAARHRFCFAPCAGRVDRLNDAPHLIWRTNLEPHYGRREARFQCSPLADRAAARRRRHLVNLLDARGERSREAA